MSILRHTLRALLAFTFRWLGEFLDERVGVIRVTLRLAISRHIFPREGQSTLTIFALGMVHVQITFIASAFPLTAHHSYRALRREVAFGTVCAVVFRVLLVDVEEAVFRAKFALAGAFLAVAQVARITLSEAIRMSTPDCDRLNF